jgi:multiple sugar transport system permease protein
VAPFAAGALLLVVVPALLTVGLAFTDASGLSTPRPNGLDNLRRLGEDPLLPLSLQATAVYVAAAVPLRLLVATGLGLLLAAPRRGGALYRASVYLPTAVPDVALALLFLWLLNPLYGPVNALLGLVGLPQPTWLATTGGARAAIVLMMLLPVGEAFLVVIAARRSIGSRLYEAAALEGCSPVAQLRRLTLPVMAPVLVLLALRDTLVALQAAFVAGYVLTDGGPGQRHAAAAAVRVRPVLRVRQPGYGAMLSLLLLVVTLGWSSCSCCWSGAGGWSARSGRAAEVGAVVGLPVELAVRAPDDHRAVHQHGAGVGDRAGRLPPQHGEAEGDVLVELDLPLVEEAAVRQLGRHLHRARLAGAERQRQPLDAPYRQQRRHAAAEVQRRHRHRQRPAVAHRQRHPGRAAVLVADDVGARQPVVGQRHDGDRPAEGGGDLVEPHHARRGAQHRDGEQRDRSEHQHGHEQGGAPA